MNELTQTQLKIIVERAVRPLAASVSRKRKMREELLAHVSAVFEEEYARDTDEAAALKRTSQRFGDPAELTRQLKQAVPVHDRVVWLIETIVGYRPGEPTWRRAARLAGIMFVVFAAMCVPVFAVQHRLREWPFILGAPVLVFSVTFLLHWMRQAVCRPEGIRWRRAIEVGFAAWLLVPLMTLGLCWAMSGDLGLSMTNFRAMLLFALVAPPAVALIAPATAREVRYADEWLGLPIDDKNRRPA